MLVLTRRVDQMIVITGPKTGDVIEVTVAGVNDADVRMGVAASRHITVDRSEITESKRLNPLAP